MACCAWGPCGNPTCYLCTVVPKKFPQPTPRRHDEAAGRYAVPMPKAQKPWTPADGPRPAKSKRKGPKW